MHRSTFALLILALLSSCFLRETNTNQPLDHRVVQGFQKGATAAEVVAKMGAPDEIVQLGKRSAYRYSHSVDKGTGAWLLLLGLYNEDVRSDRAWFFFDEGQRLTHVGATFQAHRASFGLSPDYDEASNDAADAERGIK